MRPTVRQRLVLIALACGVGMAATADASPITFDFSSVFNADVIVNSDPSSPTGWDPTQDGIDNAAQMFLTEAQEAFHFGHGLPNDGFFPAVSHLPFLSVFDHPDLQLAYRDWDSGFNARTTRGAPDTYTVAVPQVRYSEIILFATAGNGFGLMEVLANFANGDVANCVSAGVPDWASNFSQGDHWFPDFFVLTSERDRTNSAKAFYSQGFSIFGFRCNLGEESGFPDLPVSSLTITASPFDGSAVSVFGGVGFALDDPLPPTAPVPEPATGLMLVAGVVELARRYRKRATGRAA